MPDDLVVYADADLLRRIFQNVIANAIAYTPRGEVLIGSESDPANAGGWGLGLAIVKTFIEAHDGAVSIQSTEGAGSTFHFTLQPEPLAAASRAP